MDNRRQANGQHVVLSVDSMGRLSRWTECDRYFLGRFPAARATCSRSWQWLGDRSANQRFYMRGEIYTANHRCLDIRVNDASEHGALQVYPCHGGANQTWDYHF